MLNSAVCKEFYANTSPNDFGVMELPDILFKFLRPQMQWYYYKI